MVNMGSIYRDGLKDYTKAEEMYRHALVGCEKSLGKDHEHTKICAKNLLILYPDSMKSIEKTRELAKCYPHILTETLCVHNLLMGEGK